MSIDAYSRRYLILKHHVKTLHKETSRYFSIRSIYDTRGAVRWFIDLLPTPRFPVLVASKQEKRLYLIILHSNGDLITDGAEVAVRRVNNLNRNIDAQ